jgi:YbbR domain-containing protein
VNDLTNVKSEFSTEIPLILPEGLTALSEDGIRIFNVRVNMNIEPITDYLALTERIEIRNLNPDFTAQLGVTSASVLLFGPRTALEEIRSEQGLVLVYIDLEEFTQPGTYSVPLQYEAPESVETELFPAEIQVIINEQP